MSFSFRSGESPVPVALTGGEAGSVGDLVLRCESRTMSGKILSSVRVLLYDAGEMSPAVLNLRQVGGGAPVKMYRQSRRVLS